MYNIQRSHSPHFASVVLVPFWILNSFNSLDILLLLIRFKFQANSHNWEEKKKKKRVKEFEVNMKQQSNQSLPARLKARSQKKFVSSSDIHLRPVEDMKQGLCHVKIICNSGANRSRFQAGAQARQEEAEVLGFQHVLGHIHKTGEWVKSESILQKSSPL